MFIMIRETEIRKLARTLCAAANDASDYANEVGTPSAHLLAAKIADAASCCLCELEWVGQRLPGDREAVQEHICTAHLHREKSHQARLMLERGF
jgi:hypothetical protein